MIYYTADVHYFMASFPIPVDISPPLLVFTSICFLDRLLELIPFANSNQCVRRAYATFEPTTVVVLRSFRAVSTEIWQWGTLAWKSLETAKTIHKIIVDDFIFEILQFYSIEKLHLSKAIWALKRQIYAVQYRYLIITCWNYLTFCGVIQL
jgi:hypothetical protein